MGILDRSLLAVAWESVRRYVAQAEIDGSPPPQPDHLGEVGGEVTISRQAPTRSTMRRA